MSGERLTDHQNGGLEKRTWILVAVICAILLGVSAIMFVPVKKAVDETLPAMMVEQESAEIHSTTLTLRGTWGQQRMGKAAMTFQGVVGTAALDYTLWDGMDELDFTLSGEGREYGLLGGYGWLFTDHDRSCYILVTGLFDDDKEYTIAAPASNVEEARAICEKLGVYQDRFARVS